MYGDSKRAQRLYQQDSDAEEEEDLQPNPKLAGGKNKRVLSFNDKSDYFREQFTTTIWSLSSRISKYAPRYE